VDTHHSTIIRPFHPSICTPVEAGIILYLEKGLNRRAKRLGRDQGSRSGTDRRLQTMPESIDAVIRNRQMLGG
jgi:hypothetical protein